ncbi:MAG: hypothetical protein NC340_06610 [Ruminococcus flavefaciens]|nr:hypothetical protein [Ruminococcus flavefaciens]MCM1229700.1 hypothetical protein [Ruminococcus flavefaciens]
MEEINNKTVLRLLEDDYDECQLDYVILSNDGEYRGENSHKRAVISFFDVIGKRHRVGNRLDYGIFSLEEDKMKCRRYSADEFFSTKSSKYGDLSYWHAFHEPPYSTPYTEADFKKINGMLFTDSIEIYLWNDDFSDYFDDGKEWWGTALWSVYDSKKNRFVVIGASLTD